ncbi:hypothetical protein JOM56_009346 [Amanita muscaria]
MTTFILELALHPEIQRKAQTEIDQPNRLPTSDDRPSLPFVSALFRDGGQFFLLALRI